jgi:hypothetical protein
MKTKSKLDKIILSSWKFYDGWRKVGSYSPALKEQIKITRFGWNHLLDPKKRRTKIQKIRRLRALPLAKKLIETATTVQEHRSMKNIDYFAFVAEMNGRRIKVVISQKNKTDKIFLSVIVLK